MYKKIARFIRQNRKKQPYFYRSCFESNLSTHCKNVHKMASNQADFDIAHLNKICCCYRCEDTQVVLRHCCQQWLKVSWVRVSESCGINHEREITGRTKRQIYFYLRVSQSHITLKQILRLVLCNLSTSQSFNCTKRGIKVISSNKSILQ